MKSRESIISDIHNQIESERIPHATLFIGKMGYGTLDVALNFAQSLLCKNKVNGAYCGNCNSCHKTSKSIHPDLHFAFPVIKHEKKKREDTTSKDFLAEWREILAESRYFDQTDWANKLNAENKKLNINTTECNEIIKKLSLKSFEGGKKVLLIYLAEYLAKEGNRLLKIIEEPPSDTYIILVAEDQQKMLNTILSRCQIINTRPFTDEELLLLSEEGQMGTAFTEEGLFIANGDLNRLINLGSSVEGQDHSSQVLNWLRYCYALNSQSRHLIDWIEQFAKLSKNAQNNFLEYFLHFLREYQLYLFTNQEKLRLKKSELELVEKMKKILDAEKLDKLSQICNTLYYNLGRNVNSKIEMMNASIEIHNLLHRKLVLS